MIIKAEAIAKSIVEVSNARKAEADYLCINNIA